MARRSVCGDNWDPMSDDYYDASFNSYTQGPGSRLDRQLQPHSRLERDNAVFKLHIRNIPNQITETGVRNIFHNYGEPREVYRNPPGTGPGWAFVTYNSHREAELAIRELNNTPPFNFKVQFARSAAEKQRLKIEREREDIFNRVMSSEPYPLYSGRTPVPNFNRGIGRGRGVPSPRQTMNSHRPGDYGIYDTCSVDNDGDQDMGYFVPHIPGPHDNDPSRPVYLTVNSASGRRMVSMGRGYYPARERSVTDHHFPNFQLRTYNGDERRKISAGVEKMYDRETNGFYEFGERPDVSAISGKCVCCDKMTTCHCQRCFTWYCSRDCQKQDWHRHKANCMPLLSDGSKSVTSQQNKSCDRSSVTSSQHKSSDRSFEKKQKSEPVLNSSSANSLGASVNERNNTSSESGQRKPNVSSISNDLKPQYGNSNARKFGNQYKQNNHNNFNNFGGKKRGRPNNSGDSGSSQTSLTADTSKDVESTDMRKNSNRSSINDRLHHVPKQTENKPATNIQVQEPRVSEMSAGDVVKDAQKVTEESSDKELPKIVGCRKCEELPESKFSKVKITVTAAPTEYWVTLTDSEPIFMKIMESLNSETIPQCDPAVGTMCAAFFDGLWFRGKVTCINPEIKVLYIDYGNEEVCSRDQVKIMPLSVMDIPALAFKIRLAEGTSAKYHNLEPEFTFCVKPIKMSSGEVTIVQVEGETYESPSASRVSNSLPTESVSSKSPSAVSKTSKTTADYTPLPRPKQAIEVPQKNTNLHSSAVEGLEVGIKGGCMIKHTLVNGDFGVTIVYPEVRAEYSNLWNHLNKLTEEGPDTKFKPCVGEMVAALYSENESEILNRAYVLSVGAQYRVNFCDYGCVLKSKSVKQLPKELISIPEFSARCSVIKYSKGKENALQVGAQCMFKVIEVNETNKTVTCTVCSKNEELICTAVLKRWIPSVEDEGLKITELKSNDKVVLSVVFDQKTLFVRSVSDTHRNRMQELTQQIGAHCINAPSLDQAPSKNQLLACKFLQDGNYYRAKVMSVEKENVKVTYVDYGNLDCVTCDKLKDLPDSLKQIPCMAVRVSLKDVVDKPLTKEASDMLSQLIGHGEEMKLIRTNSYKDGVELILSDGTSLSEKVNGLLEPGWKKDLALGKTPSDGQVFMEGDITYVELPVGKTVDFVVLHKFDETTYMGGEPEGKIMRYVHLKMSEEMNSYCNSIPEEPYVPRHLELCFARFEDGVWYRAMCISEDGQKENNVLFLDFGNMAYVDKSNIRKMIPDYVKTPAVAVMCTLKGYEGNASVLKRVNELVQVNSVYKIEILERGEDGSYEIKFPDVLEKLTKEGLIPSGP